MKYPPRLVDSAISTFIDRQYIMKHQRRARIQQTESCSSYPTLQRPEISWLCQETTGKATKCNRFQTKFNPFTRAQKLEKISLLPKPTPPLVNKQNFGGKPKCHMMRRTLYRIHEPPSTPAQRRAPQLSDTETCERIAWWRCPWTVFLFYEKYGEIWFPTIVRNFAFEAHMQIIYVILGMTNSWNK